MTASPRLVAALLISLLPALAWAQDDQDGSKDHPKVSRFPGFYIADYLQNDFNSVDMYVAPETTVKKEGRTWTIVYGLKEGPKTPSAVEIVRNYTNAFKKAGGKLVFSDIETGGNTATMMAPMGKSELWLNIQLNNSNTYNTFTIVELSTMEQKVELTASEMMDALNKDGFIALHGVNFDTGKATIKPESELLLAEIVTLLKDNATLKLSVEGHTDNVGQAKANLALSKSRAESVKKFIVSKGIAAARLGSNGFGDTRPVADNRTEDGRAQNRRVELVKK